MLQRDIFLQGEGKAWLERNKDKLGQHDPVSELIEAQGIVPKSVLEIGCADGWRLRKLHEKYHCRAWGFDPGAPISYRPEISPPLLGVWRATADALPFKPYHVAFDLVIFGFCLYLCDPQDYFRIVAESDRVLQDGGHLIIHDFDPWEMKPPYRVPYEHKEGVFSHHMAFAELWTIHPAYVTIASEPDGCALLRKDMKGAFRDG